MNLFVFRKWEHPKHFMMPIERGSACLRLAAISRTTRRVALSAVTSDAPGYVPHPARLCLPVPDCKMHMSESATLATSTISSSSWRSRSLSSATVSKEDAAVHRITASLPRVPAASSEAQNAQFRPQRRRFKPTWQYISNCEEFG